MFFRHATPQQKIKQKAPMFYESEVAKELFGSNNVINNQSRSLSLNPLMLFCKDTKKQTFFGDKLDGFDFELCAKGKPIQTDVGVCVALDPI